MTISPPTRKVSKKSKWQRDAVGTPLIVTFCTYALVPDGIVLCTDLASKFSVVIVVLTLRKALWIVYFGMKGERTRNSVVEGTSGK